MAWLDHRSKYLSSVATTSDAEREALRLNCLSATEFVEKFCGRSFSFASHAENCTAAVDGSIVLDDPPLDHVSRVMTPTGSWFSVTNTTAQVATVSTSDSSLVLFSVSSGVRTTTSLDFADYPTLATLETAVEAVSGWTATIETGYELYPSADLVAPQQGNAAGKVVDLTSWKDHAGSFTVVDASAGIITGFGRGETVRIEWSSGFSDVPEPIKRATANLVISAIAGPEGRIKSESLGGYSYTLEDVSSLPMSDQKTLSLYKIRRA